MKHRWFYGNMLTLKSVFKVIVDAAPSKDAAPTCSDLFTLRRINDSFKAGVFLVLRSQLFFPLERSVILLIIFLFSFL